MLLVHEGAATTDCATDGRRPDIGFGAIVNGVNDNIDAIVSGHTHLAYNCTSRAGGRAAGDHRPVVSAGPVRHNLNQLLFTVDDTGEVIGVQHDPAADHSNADGHGDTPNYPATRPRRTIVDDAVAEAEVLGRGRRWVRSRPVQPGQAARRHRPENRGGESTLGNLVAEVQRWATDARRVGAAQIAFMNPGGLRRTWLGTIPAAIRRR